MKKLTYVVDDYEHLGDCDLAISEVRKAFPQAKNFKEWEDDDEGDLRGYISFDVPDDLVQKVEEKFPGGI